MSAERERMLVGELYDPADAELTELRRRARDLLARFNASPEPELLRDLVGHVGGDAVVEPPFHCDYGENIRVGARFYANDGGVLLVTIGDDVWIGGAAVVLPGVTIGDCAVIGAGSAVTSDVPADVVAAGNPCRPLRELEAVQ
jgi:maltose O-acetyltransferase